MQDREYAARIETVKQRAHGRWTEILACLGVEERILKRRNLPCPLCGGTDRFQYTDKFGEGNYHCRQCGPGGGFKLLQAIMGVDFNTALRDVERCLGMMPVTAPLPQLRAVGRAHEEAGPTASGTRQKPVTVGDEVDRYLSGRGLALPVYPKVLRFHPALGYYQKEAAGKSRKVAEYPAMLACIQGADGHAVTLHRTYLRDGGKLAALDAKKVLSAGINGAAVRLFDATEELAISEGIETGIALASGDRQTGLGRAQRRQSGEAVAAGHGA
jgi:putative DNA primase/helicase